MTTSGTGPGNVQRENPPLYRYIVLFLVLVFVNSLVSKFAVLTFELAPGASALYVVVALMIVFGLWFGIWGAAAAYAGCVIGAGILSGIPPGVSLYWSLADFWQVLIPLLAFRFLGADPSLRNTRDIGILLISGVVLNNLAGALWGSVSLAVGGVIPWSETGTVFFGWLLGNFIVCLILLPLMLYFLTPVIRNRDLFVRGYWH